MTKTNSVTRDYLPKKLEINPENSGWDTISVFFDELLNREINSLSDLTHWLKDKNELDAFLEEDMAWRYIKMNIDTKNKELQEAFNYFVSEISPKIAPISNQLDLKLLNSTFLNDLEGRKYEIMLRGLRKKVEIFREENIPIQTKLEQKSQEFGSISANMMVEIDGEKMTMQKAAKFLEDTNREKRETVFKKINQRRKLDQNQLNQLYTDLILLRDQVAKNANFTNYRDYMFAALGRFDYKVEDCFDFHNSIEKEVVPINSEIELDRKNKLQLTHLRPWDKYVDVSGKDPLKPFEDGKDLLTKAIQVFDKIDPFFGDCLKTMDKLGYLDLESKDGKAPGGFNYPLYESGIPFIYMNAVGTFRDMVTLMHEGGHAIHSFLMKDLELVDFQSTPSEVAELASMSMELISMDYWDVFFTDKSELKRAKKEQLIGVISTLPWVATIDKFQHWIYENPKHTNEERYAAWKKITDGLGSQITNWEGFEEIKLNNWQRQLHLYEVPFYYIEYGMAQLGAIAIWKNYKEDKKKGLQQYKAALKLGYTQSIPEIYETAGIQFDFSVDYVKSLMQFVKQELQNLEKE